MIVKVITLGFVLGIFIFLLLVWFWPWRVKLELRLTPGSFPLGVAWLAPRFCPGWGWQVKLPEGLTAARLAENLSTWAPGQGRKRLRPFRLAGLARITGLYWVLVQAVERIVAGVQVYNLQGRLRFGTGDAALTAILAGVMSVLRYTAWQNIQYQGRQFRTRPGLLVSPDFEHAGLWVDLRCIFTLAPGHIISAILMAAGHLIRNHFKRRGVVLGQRKSSH